MNLKTFAAARQKALDAIEFKSLAFELKDVGDDGVFEGYAAVFGNVDQGGDVIMPTAFEKTLSERPVVPILHQHDPHTVIGVSKEMSPDATGLHVRGQLVLDVQRAREDHALMKAGALTGLSIGYQAIKALPGKSSDGFRRALHELKLWEFSPVTFPMNELAQISAVKSFVDALRDGTLDADALSDITEVDGQWSTFVTDLKEGRTLSATSRALVEQAVAHLQALLDAADGASDGEGAAKSSEQPVEPVDVDELKATARDVLRVIFDVTKE